MTFAVLYSSLAMNPGDQLGPYVIEGPLGAGGMGEVYLAEDTRLGRKVALKVLPAEFAGDPERLARFEQEARAAAALNHPHIAAVFDVGFEQVAGRASAEAAEAGTHFIVQEYLEGESLREPLDRGALPTKKALALAGEIAEALSAAHAAGIAAASRTGAFCHEHGLAFKDQRCNFKYFFCNSIFNAFVKNCRLYIIRLS